MSRYAIHTLKHQASCTQHSFIPDLRFRDDANPMSEMRFTTLCELYSMVPRPPGIILMHMPLHINPESPSRLFSYVSDSLHSQDSSQLFWISQEHLFARNMRQHTICASTSGGVPELGSLRYTWCKFTWFPRCGKVCYLAENCTRQDAVDHPTSE